MMITLSKSVGDSFEKGGELPAAGLLLLSPKTAFRARMNIFKSGISGSGCVGRPKCASFRRMIYVDAMIFCNKFAR
jgi:hypothetical protein